MEEEGRRRWRSEEEEEGGGMNEEEGGRRKGKRGQGMGWQPSPLDALITHKLTCTGTLTFRML